MSIGSTGSAGYAFARNLATAILDAYFSQSGKYKHRHVLQPVCLSEGIGLQNDGVINDKRQSNCKYGRWEIYHQLGRASKNFAYYDNIAGFSHQVLKLAQLVGQYASPTTPNR